MVRVTKLELHRTITDIMKKEDLNHLTSKKIRNLCEKKYNIDLTSRKSEIDSIVMAFVQKYNNSKLGSDDQESSSDECDEESSECSDSESNSCSNSDCSFSNGSSAEETNDTKKSPVNKKQMIAHKKTPAAKPKAKITPTEKKLRKDEEKQEDLDDAAYARQLQAEEWNFRQRTVKNLAWFS